jgi:transposase
VKSAEQAEIEMLWSKKEALRKAKQRQEIIKQRVDVNYNYKISLYNVLYNIHIQYCLT